MESTAAVHDGKPGTTSSSSEKKSAGTTTTKRSDTEFLEMIVNTTATTATATPVPPEPQFPAEPDRYALYVTAGCPFAARPWMVQAFNGLPVRIIPLFPAAHDDGWFFAAQSTGEQELVTSYIPQKYQQEQQQEHVHENYNQYDPLHPHEKIHHLKQLYQKANTNFTGTISVPLLWDTVHDTAVNNSSLQLAEMLATELKHLATTKNGHIDLFPTAAAEPEETTAHSAMIQELHDTVTTAVYKIHAAAKDVQRREELIMQFYRKLTQLQSLLSSSSSSYLMGDQIRFVDLLFFITLIRFDIVYQWRFGLGKYSIREDYPGLWHYMQRILTEFPELSNAIYPQDIMAMYFMGTKWNQNGLGRTVPLVPHAWEKALPIMTTASASTTTSKTTTTTTSENGNTNLDNNKRIKTN